MKKPSYMRNTKTGKVVVYNKSIIEEMPWYEAIVDEPQPEQAQEEPVAAEKTKRRTWKDAVAEKAATLTDPVETTDTVKSET